MSVDRARMLFSARRFQEAARECVLALAEDEHDPDARTTLAHTLQELGKHKEALEEAQRAVADNPLDAHCHFMLATVLAKQGQPGLAERAIWEAIHLDPEAHHYHLMRGFIVHDLGRYQEALEIAEWAVKLDPERAAAFSLKGSALAGLKKKKESIQAVEQIVRHHPDSPQAHLRMARHLHDLDRPKEAFEHYRQAIRMQPDDRAIRDELLDALRARYLIYRLVRVRPGWVLGSAATVPLLLLLKNAANPRLWNQPDGAPPPPMYWVLVWTVALGFLIMWIRVPLFNITVLAHPLGRLTLHPWERTQAVQVALAFSLAVAAGAAAQLTRSGWLFVAALLLALVAGLISSKPALEPWLKQRFSSRNA